MTTPTRDELLKLAKEAGLSISTAYVEFSALERFAALLLSAHQAQAEPALAVAAENAVTMMEKAKKLLRAGGFEMEGGTISAPYNQALAELRAVLSNVPPSQAQEPSKQSEIADECAATGQTCSYGPHGPGGESQCKYCGIEQPVSGAVDEREALRSTLRTTLDRVDAALDATYIAKPEDRIRHLVDVLVQAKFAIAQALSRAQQAPAVSDEQPFMFAIMGPDGQPHFDEQCVSSLRGDLTDTVYYLNGEQDDGPYQEVAVYLRPALSRPSAAPAQQVERQELSSNATPDNDGFDRIGLIQHILRNRWGKSDAEIRQAGIDACDQLDNLIEAYLNMRSWAEANGLDTKTYGPKDRGQA